MKKQSGFTLIELMIVVAIIAILAAIAIPAYNQYIFEARAQKVTETYDVMRRAVPAEMKKAVAEAIRTNQTTADILPDDADGWVAEVIAPNCTAADPAPDGCPQAAQSNAAAYVDGATPDATEGRVAIQVEGGTGDVVIVHLPAYNGLTASSNRFDVGQM